MAGTPQDTPEEAHTDLMALIAAAREMPPDMDRALAESYMDKHKLTSQAAPQQAVVAQNGQRSPDVAATVGRSVVSVLVIAAYIAAIIVTSGALWWLIFPLMAVGFGGWRNYEHSHDDHMRMRMDRHMARDQWRRERYMARMGYPPEQPQQPQPLPEPQPPQSKWTPPTPPVQQSTPSAPSSSSAGTEAPPANPAG